jgi:hypothetical protein
MFYRGRHPQEDLYSPIPPSPSILPSPRGPTPFHLSSSVHPQDALHTVPLQGLQWVTLKFIHAGAAVETGLWVAPEAGRPAAWAWTLGAAGRAIPSGSVEVPAGVPLASLLSFVGVDDAGDPGVWPAGEQPPRPCVEVAAGEARLINAGEAAGPPVGGMGPGGAGRTLVEWGAQLSLVGRAGEDVTLKARAVVKPFLEAA